MSKFFNLKYNVRQIPTRGSSKLLWRAGKNRGLFAQDNAQEEEIRRIHKKAGEDRIEAEKKANFKAAMLFLESKNPKAKEGAKNFHGIPQASSTFSISAIELRGALTKMHAKSSAVTPAAPAETPEVDEEKKNYIDYVYKTAIGEIKTVSCGYREYKASLRPG